MNQSQLVESIAESTHLAQTAIEDIFNTTLELIMKNVKKGDDVVLVGFGTFTRAPCKARMSKDPLTGKSVQSPARKVPHFRPSREFKNLLRTHS